MSKNVKPQANIADYVKRLTENDAAFEVDFMAARQAGAQLCDEIEASKAVRKDDMIELARAYKNSIADEPHPYKFKTKKAAAEAIRNEMIRRAECVSKREILNRIMAWPEHVLMTAQAAIEDAPVAKPKRAAKAKREADATIVAKYVAELKAAFKADDMWGDVDTSAFQAVYRRLTADKAAKREEIVAIASGFYVPIAPSTPKFKALGHIYGRYSHLVRHMDRGASIIETRKPRAVTA